MKSILKSICALSMVEAAALRNISIIPGEGVLLNGWHPWEELPLVGLAGMTISSEIEGKSLLFTTELNAWLSEPISPSGHSYCFLATAVDGSRYLIGKFEPPYPIVDTDVTFPSDVTSRAGCSIKVTFTDSLGLMPVLG